MKIRQAILLSSAVLLTLIAPAQALDLVPFPVRNQSPLVQIFGLPPASSGQVIAPGRTEVGLTSQVASHFSFSDSRNETIFLDGETYRFDLAFRFGLGTGFEVGAEIPYLLHRGGFLDGFIIDWHDFFHLPQNDRDRAPKDRLLFSYAENGRERLRLDQDAEGFGDLRLSGAWQWQQTARGAAALHASLKLPTGDSDRFLGSGSTDLALWLSGNRKYLVGEHELALFGGIGGLLLTDGDILAGRQRNLVGFGTLCGAWRPLSWLAFKVQLDSHTPFYDSRLSQLGESVQLTVGGTLDWGATALDLAVAEDIAVDTAPDVTFVVALRRVF